MRVRRSYQLPGAYLDLNVQTLYPVSPFYFIGTVLFGLHSYTLKSVLVFKKFLSITLEVSLKGTVGKYKDHFSSAWAICFENKFHFKGKKDQEKPLPLQYIYFRIRTAEMKQHR